VIPKCGQVELRNSETPDGLIGRKFDGSLREWVDRINQFAEEEVSKEDIDIDHS
jgi:hypothetical protein